MLATGQNTLHGVGIENAAVLRGLLSGASNLVSAVMLGAIARDVRRPFGN
jgi:hypothetical protein